MSVLFITGLVEMIKVNPPATSYACIDNVRTKAY